MIKKNQISFLIFFVLLFYSCNGQLSTNNVCKDKFKKARDIAYTGSVRKSALDSALALVNECMQCDSIKRTVVDFKITLLVSMKKYTEGILFIDSLKENDFTFGYKKNLMSKNLQALDYGSKNDTVNQRLLYREISNDIEQYINKQNIGNAEFKEIFTDLFAVQENYLDTMQINKKAEDLKKRYPEHAAFFDFLKK